MEYRGGLTASIGVSDLGRSIEWYQQILGFELLYRRDDIAWAEMRTSLENVNLGLSEVEQAGGPGGATLVFGVADIDEAKKALDGYGIRQDGEIRDIPGLVRLLTFYDPDGNTLMFYQELVNVPA